MSDDARKIYGDIIDLPHYSNPKRKHMSLYDRAAQFAPFAALSGYDEMVNEEARLTGSEKELSDHEKDILNRKLHLIIKALNDNCIPEIELTFFIPDKLKSGGSYKKITALVKAVDLTEKQLILYGSYDIFDRRISPVNIAFDKIRNITGDLTDNTEE